MTGDIVAGTLQHCGLRQATGVIETAFIRSQRLIETRRLLEVLGIVIYRVVTIQLNFHGSVLN